MHHQAAINTEAIQHELFFCGWRMKQDNICIPFGTNLQRLPRTHRNKLNGIAGLLSKGWQDHIQQSGILCGGCGNEQQICILR